MTSGPLPSLAGGSSGRVIRRTTRLFSFSDEPWEEALRESLPLLVLAAVCLLIGLVIFPYESGGSSTGQLYAILFIVVGSIAGGGGVASLFARGQLDEESSAETETVETDIAHRPATPLVEWKGVAQPAESIDWVGRPNEDAAFGLDLEAAPPPTPAGRPRSVDPVGHAASRYQEAASAPDEVLPEWHEGPVTPEVDLPPVAPPTTDSPPLSSVIASLEAIADSVHARSGIRPGTLGKPVECEQCGRELLEGREVPHCQSCGRILCPSCRDLHEGSGGQGLCMECALLYDPPNR